MEITSYPVLGSLSAKTIKKADGERTGSGREKERAGSEKPGSMVLKTSFRGTSAPGIPCD